MTTRFLFGDPVAETAARLLAANDLIDPDQPDTQLTLDMENNP